MIYMQQIFGHAWLRSAISLALAGVVAAGPCGCRSVDTGEQEQGELSLPASPPAAAIPKAEMLDEAPLLLDDVVPVDDGGVEEEFVFPEREALPEPPPPSSEYPTHLIKTDPDGLLEDVSFAFDAAPLSEVVPMFSALLEFGYMVDPAVKGAVTLKVSPQQMTAREVWEMFEHILWLAGAYASRNPGFIHILPFSKMPQERRLLATHDPMANVEVAFIPIMHVKSADLIGNIKPFLTEGASLTDIPRANTLLIVESPVNVPKLRELIVRLDTKGEAAWPHITLRCHEVDAEVVLQELESLLPVLGLPVTSKGPSGGQVKLAAIPRLQVIVASAAMKEVLDEVAEWCERLDRSDKGEQENLFFYNVRHSTPAQLSEVLGVFFNTSATKSGKTSTAKATSAKATAPGAAKTSGTARTDAAKTTRKASSLAETPEGEGSIFDTPVIVYVDEVQNRLTIKTTHRAEALVRALLKRQDVPQRQVLIEGVIADISLTAQTQFGFAYAATHSDDVGFGISNAGSWLTADGGEITTLPHMVAATASEGIAAGFIKGDKVGFINAVAGESNVRLISAPQIMAASGEQAVINVGRRVSIRTSEYGDTENYTRATYQYQDTGTILTVTPYITAGNEVRLEIEQEVSSVVEETRTADASPDISSKTLTTTLIVRDGDTVMMGGLIDTVTSDGNTGVPGLKEIPGLGWLFRTHNTTSSRQELLVLITVNVIDRASKTELLLRRYQAALGEIREKLQR